jgi:hypothetical protein
MRSCGSLSYARRSERKLWTPPEVAALGSHLDSDEVGDEVPKRRHQGLRESFVILATVARRLAPARQAQIQGTSPEAPKHAA